jgi:hypothetical protein
VSRCLISLPTGTIRALKAANTLRLPSCYRYPYCLSVWMAMKSSLRFNRHGQSDVGDDKPCSNALGKCAS